MNFFEAHHLSLLQLVLIGLPLIFSAVYHIGRLIAKHVFGMWENPFRSPFPMRLWTSFAIFNAFLAAAGITQLIELFGCILFVTLVYMINKQFGTNL